MINIKGVNKECCFRETTFYSPFILMFKVVGIYFVYILED